MVTIETVQKRIEASLDKAIAHSIFDASIKDSLLSFVFKKSSRLEGGILLDSDQIEILESIAADYSDLLIENKLVPVSIELSTDANYNHYVDSKSDQIPVGFFDFSRVEQY